MMDMIKVTNINMNPSASDVEIDKIEVELKVKLPKVYRGLLKYSNGFSIGFGLLIYGTNDIVERNMTWGIEEYAKGYIAVGDDGSGNVLLMKQDLNSTNLYVVDSGYINPEGANLVTSEFIKWITNGCIIHYDIPSTAKQVNFDNCNIILETFPVGGLRDLLTIKNIIGLEIATNELLKGAKKLPFVLVKNFPYGKAMKLVDKLGVLGKVLRIDECKT